MAGEGGRMQSAPAGGCEAVCFRRRGGRPRPPADMEEGWRDGPPGASAPTGGAKPFVSVVGAAALGRPRTWRKAGETGRRGRRPLRDGAKMGVVRKPREGQAPPLRRRTQVGGCPTRDVEDAVPYRR